ncbi:MAG TPA: UMP kinase, partial [bacterium]|nr:UMP kinase [bacterium]
MLATLMNALALQDRLEKEGLFTRVMSGIEVREVAEPFIVRRAMRHLEKGRIVIFGAGIGRPYFTTDTAAALRALEIKADAILKASKEDAIYTSDPRKNADASQLTTISAQDYLTMDLKAMDLTAIALIKDYSMPVLFFNIRKYGNMVRAVTGDAPGTTIT